MSGVSQNSLDADAIFMYKTIEAHYNVPIIVTELASVGAITFLVQGKPESEGVQKENHYTSTPFAAGEIFVSSLLDSLMCQAYYIPKISEILEQMVMGSANTSPAIMHFYRLLNLSKCSLSLIKIPTTCNSMYFSDIFEFCVKSKPHSMIPIAVYKRHEEKSDGKDRGRIQGPKQESGDAQRSQRKSYVWLHPPRRIELTPLDELFVLTENSEHDDGDQGAKQEAEE
jgi:hypothetical protein